MSDKEILERIQKVYNRVTGRSDVVLKPGSRLIKIKEIGSLILVEMVAGIEDEFDIELSYTSIKSLKTVGGLIKIIKEQ